MKRSKLAVIGLGNWLLADEGVGLHALELLREKLESADDQTKIDVDLVDIGTSGMNLLHQFDEREKIIFIDAGYCGVSPGQYRRFVPDDVVSNKDLGNYSLHEFDLIKFLEFARQMKMTGNVEVVIYCMQAAEMEMSESLSPAVQKNLPCLVEDIFNEVRAGSENLKEEYNA
jgi:hydrogenase maturation protease